MENRPFEDAFPIETGFCRCRSQVFSAMLSGHCPNQPGDISTCLGKVYGNVAHQPMSLASHVSSQDEKEGSRSKFGKHPDIFETNSAMYHSENGHGF